LQTVRFRVPFLLHDQPSLSLFPYTWFITKSDLHLEWPARL
jgi:hypothetical protein